MQTIGELQNGFKLYALCSSCRRMEALSLAKLVADLGASTTVATIRARIRCRRCGRRTQDIRIVFTGQCDRAAGFHYRGNSDA